MIVKKGDFVPAIIKRAVRYSFKYGWHGRYTNWQQALPLTTGYHADVILQRVKNAARQVKQGEAVYERDAVIYNQVEIAFPLLATLLWIASQNKNELCVLDYGGSLGTSYRQNYPFLKHLSVLHWGIVEQEMFVNEGRKNFEDKHLHFYQSFDEAMANMPQPDLIMFSSSLQYLEKPYEVLDAVVQAKVPYLFIDRTAFINEPDDRLTVQTVPPFYYDASYPCWFFSENKMFDYLSKTHAPVYDFISGQKVILGLQELEYTGQLWHRK